MSYLDSTTSNLAIIKPRNQVQRGLCTAIPTDWAVRYFPQEMVYVRKLSDVERIASDFDTSDATVAWYGAFQHIDSDRVVITNSLLSLQSQCHKNGVLIQYVN